MHSGNRHFAIVASDYIPSKKNPIAWSHQDFSISSIVIYHVGYLSLIGMFSKQNVSVVILTFFCVLSIALNKKREKISTWQFHCIELKLLKEWRIVYSETSHTKLHV